MSNPWRIRQQVNKLESDAYPSEAISGRDFTMTYLPHPCYHQVVVTIEN
jgi:hypothetical protein